MRDSTQRFSSRVDDYVRYRPTYPRALLDLLAHECGLTKRWVVADIGVGPGNLARLFLDRGNTVCGVEPNREMREAGERLLAGYPRYHSLDGRAEATGLPEDSVDVVVSGQAYHWLHPDRARREFSRILRWPQWVVLVWNECQTSSTPFLKGYEALLLRHPTDYVSVRHQDVAPEHAIESLFGARGYRVERFDNVLWFDLDGLRGRRRSSSYVPEVGQPGHDVLMDGAEGLFAAHQIDGRVAFAYDTRVYYGQLESLKDHPEDRMT